MLSDQEMCQVQKSVYVVVFAKSANNAVALVTSNTSKMKVCVVPCQICNRIEHDALNCYNRYDADKFPPTTNRSSALVAKILAIVTYCGETSKAHWYPNYEADNHVSKDHEGHLAKISKVMIIFIQLLENP